MKLRINPLVAVDLKEIKDFIAEDNEGKALETIQEFTANLRISSSSHILELICLNELSSRQIVSMWCGMIMSGCIRLVKRLLRFIE